MLFKYIFSDNDKLNMIINFYLLIDLTKNILF